MKYPKHYEGDDGWCDWVYPRMEGYRLACCDCGLVHDMQFRIDGLEELEAFGFDLSGATVSFRARRNNRSTAAKRRGIHANKTRV